MQRRIRIAIERRLLLAELMDVCRHCLSNLDALNRIDLDRGIPSVVHFHKIKIIDSSILFSSETYRNINTAHSSLIYRLRVVVNNLNIEAATIIAYLGKEMVDREVLQTYIEYMQEKLAYTNDRLAYELENLDRKVKSNFQGHNRPKHIVYEVLTEQLDARAEGATNDGPTRRTGHFDQYLKRNKALYKDININD